MTIAKNNVIAKIAAVVAGLGLVLSSFAYAVPASAATQAELEAQIAALMAQIAAMSGGSTTGGAAFTMDMTIGASGAEVTRLQQWLISKGYAIPAGATGYFGAQTAAAVAAFQTANAITPAAGYFGPITRAKVNAMLGTSGGSTGGDTGSDNDGDLEGGAGSIEDAQFLSGLNNEEVGEDEEDVEVAGLEIEADEGSDIEITAVRLVFNEGTADEDFDDYASEVSVWFDGEEVARLDADEFNDDNNWSKTVSLDDGAIIRADETGELTVAISGVSNLDSNDDTETWTVAFDSIRFRDADGATVTEDSTGDIYDADDTATRTFSFEFFATAADAELALSLTDDAEDVNEAHVIDVDDSDDTEGVELLAFTIEVEGDSDLTVDSLPVLITTTGVNVEDAVTGLTLYMDGEEVGSETAGDADGSETVTFEDLELELEAGETYEFTVEADIVSTDGAIDNGDTIRAQITDTERDAADVEDETGEDMDERTGSASAEAHALFDAGIMVEFVSADAEETFTADDTGEEDQGLFEITFDVTAFDGDMRIDRSCEEAGADVAGQGVEYTITNTGNQTENCTLTSSSSDTEDTTNTYEVDEDKTRRFTLSVIATADATESAFAEVSIASINWGTATDDTNANYYTFNLDEFKTGALSLAGI